MDEYHSLYKEYFIKHIQREQKNPLSYSSVYYCWIKISIITKWLKTILNEKGKSICLYDIGCGDAMRMAYILTDLDIRDTVHYHGFDINQKSLQIARLRFQYCEISHFVFEKTNIMQGIPRDENSADVIISSEVLEHLPTPERLLKEAFRLLKHGGVAVFTTPHKRAVLNRINHLLGRQTSENKENTQKIDEEGFGHISVKPLRRWVDLMRRAGFHLMDIKYGSLLFGTPRLNNTPIFFAISLFTEKILRILPKRFQTGEDALFMIRKP